MSVQSVPGSAVARKRVDAVPRLRSRHLLSVADLTPEEIQLILDTSEAMKEIGTRPIKKVPTLRGKTVVNLFLEPSTRTRISFEIAEKRLSADTLNIVAGTSSILKGETLADTARNLEAMVPDMIVVRHASSGACHLLADICNARVINAGDGMHEHPTQALLDALTIREHKPSIAGLKVAIVGDLPAQSGVAVERPPAAGAPRRRLGVRTAEPSWCRASSGSASTRRPPSIARSPMPTW